MSKIAIIGAGIAGIACAQRLLAHGHEVTVLEKSRGYGGRCATKRWEGCRVDHGAQYFTQRDPRFREALQAACGPRVRTLEMALLTEKGLPLRPEERFYHEAGNSHLIRDLATGVTVRFEVTVDAVSRASQGWEVAGTIYDQVISTAPLPQTHRLFGMKEAVTADYVPCLTLLLLYEGQGLGLTADRYAISDTSGHDLAWSACESHKIGRTDTGKTLMVAQASEAFSRRHLEMTPEQWVPLLLPQVEERWQLPSTSLRAQHGHRWRYARVTQALPSPQLPEGLHFCGDALIASRVESAWLSGFEKADQIHGLEAN